MDFFGKRAYYKKLGRVLKALVPKFHTTRLLKGDRRKTGRCEAETDSRYTTLCLNSFVTSQKNLRDTDLLSAICSKHLRRRQFAADQTGACRCSVLNLMDDPLSMLSALARRDAHDMCRRSSISLQLRTVEQEGWG